MASAEIVRPWPAGRGPAGPSRAGTGARTRRAGVIHRLGTLTVAAAVNLSGLCLSASLRADTHPLALLPGFSERSRCLRGDPTKKGVCDSTHR
ncbi:hypothetical protein GCM10028793_56400 [Nocardiopsis oceani]